MSVGYFNVKYYVCTCDICGKVSDPIQKIESIYNSAQAARSIGWSFGKDGSTHCPNCRVLDRSDRHIDRW